MTIAAVCAPVVITSSPTTDTTVRKGQEARQDGQKNSFKIHGAVADISLPFVLRSEEE